MKKTILFWAVMILLLVAEVAWGAVPEAINIQGKIAPIPAPESQITFDVGFAKGLGGWTSHWSKTVPVSSLNIDKDGMFSYYLESQEEYPPTLYSAFKSPDQAHLKISVDGKPVGKQAFASVPYAFRAAMTDSVSADLKAVNSSDQYHYGWMGGINPRQTGSAPLWATGQAAETGVIKAGIYGQVENGYAYGYLGRAEYASPTATTTTADKVFGLYAVGPNHYLRGSVEVEGNLKISGNTVLMGRVGIKTKSPEACLDINGLAGTGGALLIQRDEDNYADTRAKLVISSGNGPPGLRISMSSDNGVSYKDTMLLDENGNVSIGTTETTNHKLHVQGSAMVAGSVSIGTSNAGGYKLYVNGNAKTTGQWLGSDLRWKKNIAPLQNSLEKVVQLQPVNYEWRISEYPERGFTAGPQIGLIAQDVEKVLPELVNTDQDGYKALAYDKLSAVLVGAIKELKAGNDELRAEIEALKLKVK